MPGMDFTSDPAVSCILFPADDANGQEYLDLSVSDDYGVGKLIRCGLDAVYGLGRRGQRIYDASTVRRGILSIEEHVGPRKIKGAQPMARAHQGHGNIGLNNWAVAYHSSEAGAGELIVPAAEPLHERIYPSLVKTQGDRPSYDIQDLVYFCAPESADTLETVAWDDAAKVPLGAVLADEPDRELEGDAVYLPVWEDRLLGLVLTMGAGDYRIDWTGSGVRFARVPRNCRGTIDALDLRLVPMVLGNSGPQLGAALTAVAFAFFGIPVEKLGVRDELVCGSHLARLAPYFYDLRHLIDLIAVGTPQFHLLEHALKKDGYAGAKRFLGGAGNSPPLAVNLADLTADATKRGADPRVLKTLGEYLANPSGLVATLDSMAYVFMPNVGAIREPGHFTIEERASAASTRELILSVWPRRNCYSYSFIGLVRGPDKRRHVLLAVTGGQGGLRPRGEAGAPNRFRRALQTAFNLETAVRRILTDQLTQLWGSEWGYPDPGDDTDNVRLLLLDQGMDVHQWIGTGGVNYVIGGSPDRSRLSALLTVLTA